MSNSNYNKNHGYPLNDKSIKKKIDQWNECQAHEEHIKELLKDPKLFKTEKAYHKWKQEAKNLKAINRARNKMISGLVQFMDGLGELKSESQQWICDPDYINMIVMTAFSRSTFNDNTHHWAMAEKFFQENRNTSLPGGLSGNGKEKIVRENDLPWYGLQFLYRQLEFTRFVPNFEIFSGIWNLENQLSESAVSLIDHWFYIHKHEIQEPKDLCDFTKGYFFRYNSKMTTQAQAQTLYILNNLFRYSLSKPIGTLEYPPWFADSTITGNKDGNLTFSKNIIPHQFDLRKLHNFNTAPIIMEQISGMSLFPSEPEDISDDKEVAGKIVSREYEAVEDVLEDVEKVEKSRDVGDYKTDEDQRWDQDEKFKVELGKYSVTVHGNEIIKIKKDGEKVEKIVHKGIKYKVGGSYKKNKK